MNKIVVDSSVILKWLYKDNETHLEESDALLRDATENKVKLLTIELAKFEVCNVLLTAKKLSVNDGKVALELFYSLPIQYFIQTESLSKDSFIIGDMAKITFYDASFIALTKQEGATLITDNLKHQGKFKGVKVIVLKDYK